MARCEGYGLCIDDTVTRPHGLEAKRQSSCILLSPARDGHDFSDSWIHEVAVIGAISITVILEPIKPKWKMVAAILGMALSTVYWGPPDSLVRDVLKSPPLETRWVTATVQVGGDCIVCPSPTATDAYLGVQPHLE